MNLYDWAVVMVFGSTFVMGLIVVLIKLAERF